jgi:hypothetical protein
MRIFFCLLIVTALGACAAGNYQLQAGADDTSKGNALAQIMAECQEQLLSPEFDVIRSRVNMSMTGAEPGSFMLANIEFPTPAERIEIARWSEIRDYCSQRIVALINNPPAGISQALWQKVVEITQRDNQRQHVLMMALARGDIPYGPFVQESTQITARTAAAVQPFIQEAGVLDQVAMSQTEEQSAAALGAFFGNLLGATLETLADTADTGSFSRGFYHRHGDAWHRNDNRWRGGGYVRLVHKPAMKPVASNIKRSGS